jgi:LuxR family maltose regulon positive regulatory protein
MALSLIGTKLFFPPHRGKLVARPRLIEKLTLGLKGQLTLISAPAGSGKTTLLSTWKAGSGSKFPTAWFSLDVGDNDPVRFCAYLAAALGTLQEGLTEGTQLLLSGLHSETTEGILTSLINDILLFPKDFALVLDDFHVITSPAVNDGLRFLIDHQPPQMHIVILTRADPLLPLARLRARNALVEIRAMDLRFSTEEEVVFLNQVMALGLSMPEIQALEQRIEGWVAGFQLAAIAMQLKIAEEGREGVQEFVATFSGSHHYIVEYLVDEVFTQQPEVVRDFLLKTSILDRFNSALCQAVLASCLPGGENRLHPSDQNLFLKDLDRNNLFLVPLDDEHLWFRYHPLFAGVLRKRLTQTFPHLLPVLHRAAASWFEQYGFVIEAFSHIFNAGDLEYAANLLEKHGRTMLMRTEWVTLAEMLSRIHVFVHQRPALGLLQAWIFSLTGQWDKVGVLLEEIEEIIAGDSRLDKNGITEMLGEISTLRGLITYFQGNAEEAVKYCRQALTNLNEQDPVRRSIASHILGESLNRCGDLLGAVEANRQAAQLAKASGSLLMMVSALTALGDLQMGQGKLHAAREAYDEALEAVTRKDGKRLLPAGRASVCMSKIFYEWNDLPEAGRLIQECIELCRQNGDFEYLVMGYVMEARYFQALGDLKSASNSMHSAKSLTKEHRLPATTASLMESIRIPLLLATDLPEALRWGQDCGLAASDDISFTRELAYRSLVRVLAAQGNYKTALLLARRLNASAESASRMGWVIHLLVLQAVLLYQSGDSPQALVELGRALKLAQPEGYQRVFLDEGKPVVELLKKFRLDQVQGKMVTFEMPYLDRLLFSFRSQETGSTSSIISSKVPSLVEPLSDRELEVVGILALGMTNQEIASRLFLALGTVKRHLNNIYGKLGVENRTQCINKARELSLLGKENKPGM